MGVSSVQFSSVTQLCPTLCDPMNCSTPALPVYHQLPEFTQTHVHWVSDAIQPSHPLSSPSPPAPNPWSLVEMRWDIYNTCFLAIIFYVLKLTRIVVSGFLLGHKKYVLYFDSVNISSVQFSCSVVSHSLRRHESQHARPPCPSPTCGVHSDSHPSIQWCHPAIASSVVPFSSCPQSLPASVIIHISKSRFHRTIIIFF